MLRQLHVPNFSFHRYPVLFLSFLNKEILLSSFSSALLIDEKNFSIMLKLGYYPFHSIFDVCLLQLAFPNYDYFPS